MLLLISSWGSRPLRHQQLARMLDAWKCVVHAAYCCMMHA